jgi:hypothetical protein
MQFLTRSLVLCVCFVDRCLFLWPLFFFDIWILITPLVSSNSSLHPGSNFFTKNNITEIQPFFYSLNHSMFSGVKQNQRLSRACIVHLVIKRTNWSYVKTTSCSGSHLGIPINIKNTKFVKDLLMIDAQFRFNQCNSFREENISVFSHMVLC